MAANITSAALFRTVGKYQPTLLVDEADTFLSEHEELRGIINSGHRRASAFAVRCCGDEQEPKTFSTWAPKAIAAIGRLPETIQDRSIMIPMRRRAPGETAKRFRRDRLEGELRRIQSQCVRWIKDNLDSLRTFDPEEVSFLDDRQQDSWRPLFAIAEVAGGAWPNLARDSARRLSEKGAEGETSLRVQALADLRDLFEREKREKPEKDCQLSSLDIVKALAEMEDRPWAEYGKQKKSITQWQLASLLRPFGIRPKQFRKEEKTRGYKLEDCQDSFSRYLGDFDSVHPVQPATDAGFQAKTDPVQQETCTESSLAASDTKERCVPLVPDRKGGIGLVAEVEEVI